MAPDPPGTGHGPRSARHANYTIEVRLDPATHSLEGRQRLTWRNLQDTPAEELWFHLYWNAWRNERSTWMLEDRFRSRSEIDLDNIEPGDWGFIEVDTVTPAAVTRFSAPDDGNPDDRTVLVVTLPAPVEPGESIEVEMTWHARVPRTFARTGRRGDFYFLAHWFPKLGVYEAEGWNCHQYHAATEYYSDYGVYDVSITVPRELVVGATGRRIELLDNADGTATHRYREADVHAFSWTASPDYVERLDRFESAGLPPVDIRLLMQPEHVGQADRHLAATRAALELYGSWYGPYPYGHVTVVDPAWESGAGGMEYPTLFTCGTRLFAPFGGGQPESVTIHEAGHQFWYGLIGNDEFEHAWLDEGLNTYSTGRVYAETFGDRFLMERYFKPPGTSVSRGFLPFLFRDLRLTWEVPADRIDRYRKSARSDVPSDPTWRYHPKTAGDISYSKTALWLVTLERYLGWPVLRSILAAFFERNRFGHPGPEQFVSVAEEVAGRDLSWFFDQVLYGAAVFDYAVESVSSRPAPARGLFEEGAGVAYRDGAAVEGERFRSEVVVRRLGDGIFPVDVLLVYEDGTEVRHRWDGESLWRLFAEESASRLAWAAIDPERVLMLDVDYTNNSREREPTATFPAVKWASKWLAWFQDLLWTFAWFA